MYVKYTKHVCPWHMIFLGLPKDSPNSASALQWLLSQPELTDGLLKSAQGDYSVILTLLGILEHGLSVKKLVDRVIDSCMSFSHASFYFSLTPC